MKSFTVRAARCDHLSKQEGIDETLHRILSPLDRSRERLKQARRIAIKANVVLEPNRIRCVDGRRQELVDDTVLRGMLRWLRGETTAQLSLIDSTYHPEGPDASVDIHFRPLLDEFDIEYIECTRQPMDWFEAPEGSLFRRYQLNRRFHEFDELVSIATLKSHAFMGVTLSTKNLFGLCPVHPDNRPRRYFHHFVRLPYVLADLGRLLNPCLCVIDGLVGQSFREWGGQARVADTLIAGDHCIATDACAAHLMGHDPSADWPVPPFRRDRNHLRVAAESGFGTVNLDRIDFVHDLVAPVASFDSEATDSMEMVESWRQTTCEQALHYQDRQAEFKARYPNEYLFLQDGEVVWHDCDRPHGHSRRQLSGDRKDSALWLKFVDPEDREGERFEVYERERRRLMEGTASVAG